MPVTPPPDLIAVFKREFGPGVNNGANIFSNLQPTAVYFQSPKDGDPSVAGGGYSGKLVIDVWDGGTNLLPTSGDIWFDRLTEFSISTTGSGAYAKSATINLTGRYFYSNDRSSWRWCPKAKMARQGGTCADSTGYKDITVSVDVTFRNNELGTAPGASGLIDRPSGGIYFFKLFLPPFRM